jgi:acetylornithine deacetylase/succinyl-diaminopimelate desuccinylase-like protein
MSFDKDSINTFIDKTFWQSYVPSLQQFIAIPNTSRLYDPDWYTNGLLEQAGKHIQSWVEGLNIKGLKSELMKLEGFSPLLFVEVEGEAEHTILYYGHFDKQPHMGGWDADKGPTKPVIIGNCLYGRGGGDDGYAAYSSMLAVKAVQ